MTSYPKRLIEVDLLIKRISVHTRRKSLFVPTQSDINAIRKATDTLEKLKKNMKVI
jgi:hypothetical protein